ncbi:UPF0481 protein At3g47200-like [Impatiens glandulifera]|uniref:UPF0481 protein At3g47200-like n=1 Tax=Impatiens glandulifera TaxID=253017 RepID=UPI001FB164C4|nr:UPF0481 protein At3g47200-like [Impatiens glandulifera]
MDGGIPMFDGEGYELWDKKMMTLFLSLDLWDIVQTENLEALAEKRKEPLSELKKRDNKALYLIHQGVSNNIFSIIIEADSSNEAWDIIRDLSYVEEQQSDSEIEIVEVVTDIIQEKCIFRVPQEMCRGNDHQEFYEPKVLAIGPYHHGKPNLDSMEVHKKIYLKKFLRRTDNESMNSLVQAVMQHEQRVRKCYGESNITNVNRDKLAQMMVFDGCFIIELLHRYSDPNYSINDSMFNSNISLIALQNDMLLVENQIPFFILKILFDKILPTPGYSLINNTFVFFGNRLKKYNKYDSLLSEEEVYHLLHIIHKFVTSLFLPLPLQRQTKTTPFMISATNMEETNVKLKMSSDISRSMLDITFKKGKLEIPCWNVDNQSEIEFRNIIAFEMCQQLPEKRFSDYAIFMDHLVASSNDVNLLTNRGIFNNQMINANSINIMLENLTYNIHPSDSYTYHKITKDLNTYCESRWNKWIFYLKQKYLKNPWTVLSLFAGGVIIGLAIVQTVYAIKK